MMLWIPPDVLSIKLARVLHTVETFLLIFNVFLPNSIILTYYDYSNSAVLACCFISCRRYLQIESHFFKLYLI